MYLLYDNVEHNFIIFSVFLSHFAMSCGSCVGINPERGTKAQHGKATSKKRGKMVQKKVTSLNPHVCTLLRKLMDFEWDFVWVDTNFFCWVDLQMYTHIPKHQLLVVVTVSSLRLIHNYCVEKYLKIYIYIHMYILVLFIMLNLNLDTDSILAAYRKVKLSFCLVNTQSLMGAAFSGATDKSVWYPHTQCLHIT